MKIVYIRKLLPAPAGVIPGIAINPSFRSAFTRTCGGDPAALLTKQPSESLLPAPAGVILGSDLVLRQAEPFTRTCGGDPLSDVLLIAFVSFYPHLRG